MFNFKYLRSNWFGNVSGDLLSGTVVALALIPEAIAFSIIAGVDPKVGLYASFCIAVICAFVGGRPGMISAATGAMAIAMVSLVKDYGLEYLFAASLLTGIIQIIAGYLRLGSLMRYISRSVVTGFVNALAILIFSAQLPEFSGAGLQVYLMVALGLTVIYLLPYLTKVVPSALVCIIALTAISLYHRMDLRTVGDMGSLPDALPVFMFPKVPLTFETFQIILPYSLTLAAIGLLESLMTATIIDELTDTESDKDQECAGQGIANIGASLFGGMAGCAMIGQSVINYTSGGRGRLSTFFAGMLLLFLIVVAGEWVKLIPMVALVSVMIMVSIGTFNWASIYEIPKRTKSSTFITFTTVAVVLLTHDLAKGVLVGVLLSAVTFTSSIAKLVKVKETESGEDHVKYVVIGQIFFASTNNFISGFNFKKITNKVIIDISLAHFWDSCAVDALEKVLSKFKSQNIDVQILGKNNINISMVERLSPALITDTL